MGLSSVVFRESSQGGPGVGGAGLGLSNAGFRVLGLGDVGYRQFVKGSVF